jgi:hypothetical protein
MEHCVVSMSWDPGWDRGNISHSIFCLGGTSKEMSYAMFGITNSKIKVTFHNCTPCVIKIALYFAVCNEFQYKQ